MFNFVVKKNTQLFLVVFVILGLLNSGLFAEDKAAASSSDTDSFFNSDDSDTTATLSTAPNPIDIPDRKPLTFTAGFSAAGGFASGWNSWDNVAKGAEYLDLTPGVIVSTSLAFKAHFSNQFSFQGGVTVVYPATLEAVSNPTGNLFTPTASKPLSATTSLFAVTIGDIFADYSVADALFIKVGRFGQTWGNSLLFKAADAINRYNPTTMDDDGIRLKLTVPLGPVNASVMGQAFNGYFSNNTSISLTSIGGAVFVDMPIGPVEMGVGYFYQRKLTPRIVTTLKTSISPIDFFVDASLALDYGRSEGAPATNNAYFSLGAGLYGDVKEIMSQFYLEYLFNGERLYDDSSQIWSNVLPDSYQPGGHNISLIWRLKLEKHAVVQPVAQFAYNFNDCSAAIIPGVSIYITDNLKLQFGIPIYLGHEGFTGEVNYLNSNILQGHVVGLTMRLMLTGTATTE